MVSSLENHWLCTIWYIMSPMTSPSLDNMNIQRNRQRNIEIAFFSRDEMYRRRPDFWGAMYWRRTHMTQEYALETIPLGWYSVLSVCNMPYYAPKWETPCCLWASSMLRNYKKSKSTRLDKYLRSAIIRCRHIWDIERFNSVITDRNVFPFGWSSDNWSHSGNDWSNSVPVFIPTHLVEHINRQRKTSSNFYQ